MTRITNCMHVNRCQQPRSAPATQPRVHTCVHRIDGKTGLAVARTPSVAGHRNIVEEEMFKEKFVFVLFGGAFTTLPRFYPRGSELETFPCAYFPQLMPYNGSHCCANRCGTKLIYYNASPARHRLVLA